MKKLLRRESGNILVYAILIGPFVSLLAIINPFHNVLYGGDEWAYAWSVKQLITFGNLQVSDWASAAAIPQILWAGLFSRVLGFTFLNLNLSTVVFSFLGLFLIYWLIAQLGFEKHLAAVAASLVCITPLYIGFAGTFMSDIFYTVLMMGACLLYVIALQENRVDYALAGGLVTSFAFLSRQIGIVLLISFALTVGYLALTATSTKAKHKYATILVVGGIVPLSIFILFQMIPSVFGGRSLAQALTLNWWGIINNLGWGNVTRLFLLWNYVVILLFPVLVSGFWQKRTWVIDCLRKMWGWALVVWLFLIMVVIKFIIKGENFIVRGDVMHVGSSYAKDITDASLLAWKALILICTVVTTILAILIIERLKVLIVSSTTHKSIFLSAHLKQVRPEWLFLALSLTGHIILIILYPAFNNNYFLPLLPLFAVMFTYIIGHYLPDYRVVFPMLICSLILTVITIEPQKRYVEANWKVADELIQTGEPYSEVFAWPSWYGWYNYEDVIADIRAHEYLGLGAFNVFGREREKACFVISGETDYWVKEPLEIKLVKFRHLFGNDELFLGTFCKNNH